GPPPPSRLVALRHGARRLPAPAHDARGTLRGLRVVLSTALLPRVDLAAAAARSGRRAAVPRDVVPLQAQQLALARPDPASHSRETVAAARRNHAAPPPRLSGPPRGDAGTHSDRDSRE